ncbi:MAG: helix-turn-helix domain-containing protein [bacterium]
MAWRRSFTRYLTVNNSARDWQVYCTDCGCMESDPGEAYPPNPHHHPPEYRKNLSSGRILGEFQIVYITRGAGFFHSEYTPRRRVNAGDCLILFPGVRHGYMPDPLTGWDEYWVGFSGDYPALLMEKGFIDPSTPVLGTGYSERLVNHYIRLFEIASVEAPGFQLELGAATMTILAGILAIRRGAEQRSRSSEIVERAKIHMDERVNGELDIEALSAQLGIGYSSFLEHFKEYTGLSPYRYFLQLKVNTAKHLLRDRGLSVKEAAHHLGFEDQFYFSRLFKKKTGVAPRDWQRGAE